MKEKIKIWLAELRAPFFTATIVPVFLGAAIAWRESNVFYWGYFLLTLIGGLFLHAGTNVANDYFDHKSKNDELNTEFVRPFTGGSRIIQKGLLTPREVLIGALVFFALGSLIGLYLFLVRGWIILVLGAIGVLSGYFYTAPPVRLCNRGVGELAVGINFGILMTLGSYFMQTGHLSWEPVVASIAVTLLILAVLYINEFQDVNADRAVGKNTLVVRLGRKNASRGFFVIMLITYLSVALGVLAGITSPFTLVAFLSIPFAAKAIKTALKYYDDNIKLTPANAATIGTHLVTGLLLTAGYFLHALLMR